MKKNMVLLFAVFFCSFSHLHAEAAKPVTVTVNGSKFLFVVGTVQYYDKEQKILHSGSLQEDKEILLGKNTLTFERGTYLTFYRNSSPAAGTLKKPAAVNGIPVKDQITFFDDGKIRRCILSADSVLKLKDQAVSFPADSTLHFYLSGSLKAWEPSSTFSGSTTRTVGSFKYSGEITIGNLNFSKGTVAFYENGGVESGKLSAALQMTMQGKPINLPANVQLYFNDRGEFSGIHLQEKTEYAYQGNKVKFEQYATLLFSDYARGELDAIGTHGREFQLGKNRLELPYPRDMSELMGIFFIRYHSYQDKKISAIRNGLSDQVIYFADKAYLARPLEWISFSPEGALLSIGKEKPDLRLIK